MVACLAASAGRGVTNLFLTGDPGVGKTTLIKRVIHRMGFAANDNTTGFYTEEVRGLRGRTGFDMVALDGQRAPLSRLAGTDIHCHQNRLNKVGRYLVCTNEIEQFAIPRLCRPPSPGGLVVCDELGKMELLCQQFYPCLKELLDDPGVCVLGTLPSSGRTLPEEVVEVRQREDTQILEITPETRDLALERVIMLLRSMMKEVKEGA